MPSPTWRRRSELRLNTRTTSSGRRTAHLRSRAVHLLRLAAFYGALLLVWQLVFAAHIWSPYLLPEPSRVFLALKRHVNNGVLLDSVEATLQRMMAGFLIAFALGMTMGI